MGFKVSLEYLRCAQVIFKAMFEYPSPPVTSFVNEGLGHSSFVVDLDDGRALVIDPARVPTAQRDHAARHGLELAFTADTHTHADYLSGSPELAGDGACFLAPAAAELEHPHRGLRDGDVVELGRYRLEAIATPGHTPDHLSYLLHDADGPAMLFSGGSLMVGTVGRTDLLGDAQRDELARELYRSLHERILPLPDALPVFPTHGAGSFCSAPGGGARTTTIGRERAQNPFLSVAGEQEFVDRLLGESGSFPPYFRRLPARNQRGVRRYEGVPALTALTAAEVDRAVAHGAVVVDARPALAYTRAHVPGAYSIALRPGFASWLGWLLDEHQEIVFVLDPDQDEEDLVRQCLTIGLDHLAGRLAGGIDAWRAGGFPVATTEVIGPDGIDRPLLDVRQASEFTAGHVPGASHRELGSLAAAALPTGPVATMCGKSERATTAASILERRGHPGVAVLRGGFTAWESVPGHTPVTEG
jgi:hydroxyacylglutathione hydrolase